MHLELIIAVLLWELRYMYRITIAQSNTYHASDSAHSRSIANRM